MMINTDDALFANLEASLTAIDTENQINPDTEIEQWKAQIATYEQIETSTYLDRGRLLRKIREVAKQTKQAFKRVCNSMALNPSTAYRWMQMADTADTLIEKGVDPVSLNKFSAKALKLLTESPDEVVTLVSSIANEEEKVSVATVRSTLWDYKIVATDLLPDSLKLYHAEGKIKSNLLGDFLTNLEKLPDQIITGILQIWEQEYQENTDITTFTKDLNRKAKVAIKILKGEAVKTTKTSGVDIVSLILENLKNDQILDWVGQFLASAQQIEALASKLTIAGLSLEKNRDRLFLESSSRTPFLRQTINSLESMLNRTIDTFDGWGIKLVTQEG